MAETGVLGPEDRTELIDGYLVEMTAQNAPHRTVIVEVADTTLTYDRTEKLVCYASNDIPEYWIANLQSRTLECYHDSAGDEYRERRTLEWGDPIAQRFDDTLELAVADLSPAPAKGRE